MVRGGVEGTAAVSKAAVVGAWRAAGRLPPLMLSTGCNECVESVQAIVEECGGLFGESGSFLSLSWA